MAVIGEAFVAVRPETAEFVDGLKGAQGKVGGFVANVGRRVGTALKVVGAATGIAGGISAASLVKMGAGYNSLEQNARASFKTILGSSKASETMMKKIRDFGKTSPFPRQAFIQGTQQMLSFGIEADKTIPILRRIQDQVAAMGKGEAEIGQLVDVFSKIQVQGKITGVELQRFGVVGVDAVAAVADKLGVSWEEARKQISAGTVDATTATDAVMEYIDKTTGGAAENLKNTWTGATDRVKGAWRDLGSVIVEPFISKEGGGYAVEWANIFADNIHKLRESIELAIPKAVELAAPLTKAVTDFDWSQVGASIGNIWDALGEVVPKFWEELQKALNPEGAAGFATKAWEFIKSGWDGLDLKEVGATISQKLVGLIDSMDFGAILQAVVSALASAASTAAGAVVQLTAAIGNLLSGIDWIGLGISLGKQVPSLLMGLVIGLLNFDLGGLLSGLANNWQAVLIGILGIAFAPARLIGAVANLLRRIPLVGRLLAWLLNAIKGIADKALGAFLNVARTIFGGFLRGFLSAFPRLAFAFDAIVTIVRGLPGRVMGFLSSLPSRIGEIFGRVGPGILSRLGGLADRLGTFAGDLVKGLINGLTSSLANFLTIVTGLVVTYIINPFKEVLGIASPSTLFMEFGGFLIEGLVNGIQAAIGLITAVMSTIWNAIVSVWNTIKDTVLGVASTIWNGIVAAWNWIRSATSTVFNAIWSVIQGVWNWISGRIQIAIALIRTIVRAAWNWIRTTTSSVFNAIWNTIQSVWNWISSRISSVVNTVRSRISSAWNTIRTNTVNAFNRVREAVSNAISRVVEIVTGIPGKVLGALGNLGRTLYDKGRDLIQGLIDGATSLLSKIGTFFLDKVPNFIKGPFKSALGIASPSKLFAGYGVNLMEGLAVGVERARGLVDKAIEDVSARTTVALDTASLQAVAASGGTSAQYHDHWNLSVTSRESTRTIEEEFQRMQRTAKPLRKR